MANAINNINKGDTTSNIYIHKVKVNNKGGNLINFVVGKNNFINLTENVIELGDSNNILPSTFKVYNVNVEDRIGKDADFNLYTSSFARILNYYNSNNELPDYCTFNSYELNNYVTINDVVIASSNLKEFIETNYYVPAYFNVGNYNVSSAQISYLMATAIKNINNKNNSDILIKELSLKADLGDDFHSNIASSIYIEFANNVSAYCDKNSYPPAIISVSDKNINFKTYTLGFATILDYYKENTKLPGASLFSTKIYENYLMYKTINEINTEDNLTKYIESENEWCVITPELQNIANELVLNSSSKLDLAINIFNFVNDATGYIFYYNSQKGAQGTLTDGGGNCCDLSHLLVAIFRASGLPARYCHGLCTFISGSVTGHVWVQVCVDNIWYVCDASNYVNTFGHIENWFIDSSSFNNYYVLLPF